MRILQITEGLGVESGGVARSVQNTSRAQAEIGLTVEILAHQQGVIDFPWKNSPPEKLTVTLVDAPSHPRLLSPAMKQALEERIPQADIIHLHGMWGLLGMRAARIARKHRKPYVISIRGMLDPWSMQQRYARKALFYTLFERRRLSRAAVLHFTAEAERTKAAPWIPSGVRTEVVSNIINLANFRDLPPLERAYELYPAIPKDAPWILFLSRIHEKKGLHHLVDAFTLLPPELNRTQLVIAGTGDEAYTSQIREQAQRLGLADRVHFVGLADMIKKTALYRTAAALCLPTSQENFGLVFPEALACETPVMLTTGVDIHNEILAAGAGYLITQDPQNIANTITEALKNPQANREKGLKGRQWVFNTLDSHNIARKWQEIYSSITPN